MYWSPPTSWIVTIRPYILPHLPAEQRRCQKLVWGCQRGGPGLRFLLRSSVALWGLLPSKDRKEHSPPKKINLRYLDRKCVSDLFIMFSNFYHCTIESEALETIFPNGNWRKLFWAKDGTGSMHASWSDKTFVGWTVRIWMSHMLITYSVDA
jgi:hypothetical protein